MLAKAMSSLPAHVSGQVCVPDAAPVGAQLSMGVLLNGPWARTVQTLDLAPQKGLAQAVRGEKQEELPAHK